MFGSSWNDNTNETDTSYSTYDDKLDIPVTSQNNLNPFQSPYLNVDSSYVPEYIFPDANVKQRGRFEYAFSQIGGSCIIGAGFGGALGLFKGIKSTTLAGQTGKLRRTQVLNHVMKNGASVANRVGVIALMYSGLHVLSSYARKNEENDSTDALIAATTTGMLFKSTAGLKRCIMGGGVGLALASIYCLWEKRESINGFPQPRMNPASK